MTSKDLTCARVLFVLVLLWGLLSIPAQSQQTVVIEGIISQIQEEKGLITVNGKVLDAQDFELEDLKVGYTIMGEAIQENGKFRLMDLEVIKKK